MKHLNRHLSPLKRLLTSLVGVVFLVSIVTAQLPYCQCGVLCLHGEGVPADEMGQTSPAGVQGCCPLERRDDEPPPKPTEHKAPCGESNGCDCPVEVNSAPDFPTVVLPFLTTSIDVRIIISGQASIAPFTPVFSGIEDAPKCHPTRGSPLPRPPLHILNSVQII